MSSSSAVGDDDVVALEELREVVFDLEAIEVAAVSEGWFVDNNFYAFTAEILNGLYARMSQGIITKVGMFLVFLNNMTDILYLTD